MAILRCCRRAFFYSFLKQNHSKVVIFAEPGSFLKSVFSAETGLSGRQDKQFCSTVRTRARPKFNISWVSSPLISKSCSCCWNVKLVAPNSGNVKSFAILPQQTFNIPRASGHPIAPKLGQKSKKFTFPVFETKMIPTSKMLFSLGLFFKICFWLGKC